MISNTKEFYSVKELCTEYSMSQSTIYNMIREKKIKAFKIGRCWKIPKEDFLQLLYDQL